MTWQTFGEFAGVELEPIAVRPAIDAAQGVVRLQLLQAPLRDGKHMVSVAEQIDLDEVTLAGQGLLLLRLRGSSCPRFSSTLHSPPATGPARTPRLGSSAGDELPHRSRDFPERSAPRCPRPPQCRAARRAPAVQHADDLQRDRAVRRPAAASRLPAAHDSLPAAGPGGDRRLRGDQPDQGGSADALGAGARPAGRLPPLRRRRSRARRSRSARTSTTRRAWVPSSARSPRRSTRSSAASGHITSGCPATSTRCEALGFQLFGLNPCVSHAYVRLVDFGKPVTIGGVEIQPGDLLHADKHGVCIIPHEIAPKLAEACAEVERRERPLLEICRSPDFTWKRTSSCGSVSQSKIHE